MSSGIVLPQEYAYPVTAVVSTFYLLFWQTFKVGTARRKAKIEYPQVYAEKAEAAASQEAAIFNCTQRAHQNTLEVLPIIVGGTLIAGLTYPVAAASLCGAWVTARILYTIGYSTGNPKKRNLFGSAVIGTFSVAGLVGTATASAIALVRKL
ncbi:membrane-associated proteins in eicosanoid and glutathione metabolism [Daedaleopsis nitida]|nr:membrane-associated proteins in eicosanoid and glutathione metabolism [Daedaleopsis nitida]